VRDQDIDKELRFHIDERAAELAAAGFSADEAARRARVEFGGVAQTTEACRDVRRRRLLDTTANDFRFALRLAAKTPVVTLTTVVALALGIGANSAIFAVVNGVLLKPLPYADPDRLVMVWSNVMQEGRPQNTLSPADYVDFARMNRTMERLEGYFSFVSPLEIVLQDQTEVAYAQTVAPGLLQLLGRQPMLGRPFRTDSYEAAAILSQSYFQRRFGGDPSVIGRTFTLSGQPATIVGVMPPDFVFPYPGMLGPAGFTRVTAVDMWVTMALDGQMAVVQRTRDQNGQLPRGVRWLGAVGRLRSQATLEQARADFSAVARQLEQTYPDTNKGWGTTLVSAREQTVGAIRPALLILLAGVGLVLLMAVVNVANLMLARSLARRKEFATRIALGAGRGRLVQQSIVESLLLAVAGGAVGLLFTRWGLALLVQLAPQDLPRLTEVSPDWRVVGATFSVALIAGAMVGLLPALAAADVDPNSALQENGRSATGSRSHRRYRGALVVAEVALAVVLTAGAALLLRSFVSVLSVNPGFEPDRLLTWQMNIPERLRTSDERRAFYRAFFERIERIPGVVSVGGTTRLPLGSTSVTTSLDIQGKPRAAADLPEVELRRSLHNYFAAMGIPILRGRGFTAADGPASPPVVVINQTLARRLFAGEDPIGQHVRTGAGANSPWMEIVGIIGDIRHSGLERAPAPELYITYLQNPPVAPFIVIRAQGDPAALADVVRAEARAIDKNLPLFDMRTMTDVRSESVAERRFIVLLVTIFGVLALVLAAVGVDGVMSVAVSERTQELGVRLALGAEPRAVVRLVIAQAGRLALAGVALGLALTWAAMPLLRSQLFGVRPNDPVTLAGVPAVLLTVALVAALIPARRAAHVDPVQVLRKA
jgi:predicted permease